jgi:hypothetical protein
MAQAKLAPDSIFVAAGQAARSRFSEGRASSAQRRAQEFLCSNQIVNSLYRT